MANSEDLYDWSMLLMEYAERWASSEILLKLARIIMKIACKTNREAMKEVVRARCPGSNSGHGVTLSHAELTLCEMDVMKKGFSFSRSKVDCIC